MANNTIVTPAEQMFIRVVGRRMTEFPDTGTYLSIEKLTNRSTFMGGLFNTATHVRTNANHYRVTMTLMQGHADDAFMQALIRTLDATAGVATFSFKYATTVYGSVNCDIEVIPPREIAADSSPTMAYALTGTFPAIIVGSFVQPPQVTEDQVLANLP